MKKILFTLFLLILTSISANSAGTIVTYTIDPEKNAYEHNNQGLVYVEEKCYYAAIQEFKIAISLNPKAQATSVYYNNLGKVYLKIGYPELACDCFEKALVQYPLNFEFYDNLAKCYKQLGRTSQQLSKFRSEQSQNPVSKVMVGLLEYQSGNAKNAITILDEFVNSEPDLIITPAVREYIKKLVEEVNKN